MLRRLTLFALAVLALMAPLTATGDGPLDPRAPGLSSTERLDTLIERIKHEQAKVHTLEARFVQHQENEFLAQPEEARGVFSYAAPDQVRWEYQVPKPITLVIDGGTMTTWYRDLGRVEEVKVGKYSERVLRYLGAGGNMEALLEYFEVAAAFPNDPTVPYRLELKPRYSRVAKRLRSLTIWIDPERFVPHRLRYEVGGGGVTEYVFEELNINKELPPDRFELDLPANVEVRVVDLDRAP